MPSCFPNSTQLRTARHHNMTLVTRNTKDFIHAQIALLDPWQ